jgi:hypothetical protein
VKAAPPALPTRHAAPGQHVTTRMAQLCMCGAAFPPNLCAPAWHRWTTSRIRAHLKDQMWHGVAIKI